MLFHSQTFILVFLPLCLGGVFLCGRYRGPLWALRFLTAASLVFYGWWDPRYVPLLISSIVINHGLTRAIRAASADHAVSTHEAAPDPQMNAGMKRWRSAATQYPTARWILTGGIMLNLAVLGLFKYSDFILLSLSLTPIGLALPLAISFFTFQQIMYLIDTYKNPGQTVLLLHAAAFVTFFPHLIAGPIVRPMEIIPQLASGGCDRPDTGNLTAGLVIFLLGLSKKLVLADMFGGFADTGFNAAAHGETLTFFEAWYATLSYSLQIYFDFSGYSDMAIGLARMLNVRFPLNFDSPYQARDIAAFWRRWHMTLGLFLRDYVYLPLGGNRRRHIVNLSVTMLLCGLWHGAAWQFVLWGALHGIFLIVHARSPWSLPSGLSRALTLLAVIVAWVPFRAADLATSAAMLAAMGGANGIALPAMILGFLPPLAWIAVPLPVLPFLGDARTLSFPEVTACLLLGWFIVLALPNVHAMSARAQNRALTAGFAFSTQAMFFAPKVAPFLYFQF